MIPLALGFSALHRSSDRSQPVPRAGRRLPPGQPGSPSTTALAIVAIVSAGAVVAASDVPAVDAAMEITKFTIDCGGGTSTGGTFVLTATIGQPEARPVIAGSGFTLASGFHGVAADPCPYDIDDNGEVDFADILDIIVNWGPCGKQCPQDADGNGDVDFADILLVIINWGPCPA